MVAVPARMDTEMRSSFEAFGVVDPLTNGAQKMSTLLEVIREVANVNIKLFLNPRGKLSELPLKRLLCIICLTS